jgi:tRNA(Ile)-lysidine synthase
VSAAEAAPVTAREAKSLFADLVGAPALILAVSGGPDSTALLFLTARWRASLRKGPKLVAVTIDHGLRPESAKEARAVARLARKLGVAHRTLRWTGAKPKTAIQEAARQARYRLLADAAAKARATHILTAHTLDDQAETMLFRLARGSGVSGLGAMARVSTMLGVPLVRPFLGLPKARLVTTLRRARLPFVQDPSNLDLRFARPRLRELMPPLAQEGLSARRFAVLAARIRRADAALEAVVDAAVRRLTRPAADGVIGLDAEGFSLLPDEVSLRLLGRAVAQVGDEGPVELAKLESLHDALLAAPLGRPFRRTLAGALVTRVGPELWIERAPARRRR